MKLFVRETVYEAQDYSASFILRILAYTFSSDNKKNRLATVLTEIRVEELALFRRVLPGGGVNTGSKPAMSCAFYK